MISLYQDILISNEVKRVDDKTKQVQVRLTPELHSKLKGTLALDGRKLVDFFNEVSNAYLKDPEKFDKTINRILGGKRNG